MRSRVIWRRSATAIGTYVAAGLGFLTTVVATRELGVHDYARFAAVIAATAFFQLLLDLTIEEALVKFGFRYVEAQRWGRLRRLFEVAVGFKLAGGMLAALAVVRPRAVRDGHLGHGRRGRADADRLADPARAGARERRRRRDHPPRPLRHPRRVPRRLDGAAARSGSRSAAGTAWSAAVVGMVVAQVAATAAIGAAGIAAFLPLPGARRPSRSATTSAGCGASSSRRHSPPRSTPRAGRSAPRSCPTVAPIVEAGYFRNAQAPATGFAALSGPARLVMLTEQTRDFEAGPPRPRDADAATGTWPARRR